MSNGLVRWALGGALAVSLGLNVWVLDRDPEVKPAEDVKTMSGGCGLENPPCGEQMLTRLDLSEQQCKDLKQCCPKCEGSRTQAVTDLKAKSRELNALLQSAEPVDETHLLTLADDVGRLQAEVLKNRIHSVLGVRETLTAEQLKVLLSEQ